MSNLSTIRHSSIFNATQHNDPIHIVGAGAIGSRIWEALVNIGLTDLSIYDYDTVSSVNISNQIYDQLDVDKQKTTALYQWTMRKLGIPESQQTDYQKQYKVYPLKIEETSTISFSNTLILAVDSIEARKMLVELAVKNGGTYHIFDTRMASTHGDIFYINALNPLSVEHYISTLPKDKETELSPCGTTLSVGPTATIIANLCVWQLMHLRSEPKALDSHIAIFLKPFCVHIT